MNFLNLLIDTLTIPIYLLLFLVVGKFFYGNLPIKFKNSFQKSYLHIFFGFIITIAFYAILRTTGKSVLSLFLLLLIIQYLVFKIKPDIYFFNKFSKQDLLSILLLFGLFIFFFIVQLYRHEYFNVNYVKLGWGDYGYYSDLAETFNITGIERGNSWYSYFNSNNIFYSSNPAPYHYFEIWTHAFLLKFAINKGIFVFIYIFTPLISMLVAGAFLTLGYTYLNKFSIAKQILLIFTAFAFPFFVGKLPFLLGGWEDNVLYYPRNFMFYILFAVFLVFYKKGLRKEAVFFIGLLSFINILYLPTISILLVLLASFQFIILKEKETAKYSFGIGFGVSFLVLLFYFVVFKSKGTHSFELDNIFPLKEYILKGLRYYFRLQLARIWFFYLPLTIFISYYIYNKIKEKNFNFLRNEIILIAVLLELISLFFASFVPHLESGTFNSIVLNPMLSVLYFMSIIYLLNNFKSIPNMLFIGFIYFQVLYSVLFVIFDIGKGPYTGRTKFGKEFLINLSEQKFDNRIGVFIANSNFKKSVFGCKQNLSWNTSVFDVIENGHTQVSLSAIIQEDSIPFEIIKHVATNTPMFKYGSNKIQNFNRSSINLSFLKDYKIEYLIFNPGAKIPKYIEPYVQNVITDKYSGIKVVLINKHKLSETTINE